MGKILLLGYISSILSVEGIRTLQRDRWVFDHIFRFDCDTGQSSQCVERCRQSEYCNKFSDRLGEIEVYRRCLYDLGRDCQFYVSSVLNKLAPTYTIKSHTTTTVPPKPDTINEDLPPRESTDDDRTLDITADISSNPQFENRSALFGIK